MSLFNLCQQFAGLHIPGTVDILAGQSLITYARNVLANRFLKSPASHLLFLDSDITFRADDVLKLIEAQKEVIGLPYSRKAINWERVHKAVKAGVQPSAIPQIASDLCVTLDESSEKQGFDLNQPVKVKAIGCGALLIGREVFTNLADAHPEWRCKIRLHDHEQEQPGVAFFNSTIDEQGNLLSEDYSFCHHWNKLGKVYMLPAVTAHIGTHRFECNTGAMKSFDFR